MHTRCSMRVNVIKGRIPKLECETCDRYPQIPVPWARPRVSYAKILEREFLTLLGNSVNRTDELCKIGLYVTWDHHVQG